MKKGFTLIELLAVILILGIIALIAIPQVTNVIEDSKKGAVEVSKKNYIKVLQEDRVSLEELKDGTVLEGVKTVSEINTAYPNLVSGDVSEAMRDISNLSVSCSDCYMQNNTFFNNYSVLMNANAEGNADVTDIFEKFVCGISVEEGFGCGIFEELPVP